MTGRFQPTVGGFLVASLPSEKMRAEVVRILGAHGAVVRIGQPLVSQREFKKGQLLVVRRQRDMLNGKDDWVATDEPVPTEEPKARRTRHAAAQG